MNPIQVSVMWWEQLRAVQAGRRRTKVWLVAAENVFGAGVR